MGAATFYNYHITPVSSDAKRYFCLMYNAPNWNAASVTITDGKSNAVFNAAQELVHFTGVSAFFTSAAAGVKGMMYLGTTKAPVSQCYSEPFTTTALNHAVEWKPDVTFARSAMIENNFEWFSLYDLSAYAAGDDVTIVFWGWIDALELQHDTGQPVRFVAPQTVSVEGVKLWSRR